MTEPSNQLSDYYPLHDVQAQQVDEEKGTWFTVALISFISIVGGFGIFLATYWTQLTPGLNREIFLGLNATTIVLILACAYLFAYRFFDDLFYLFIAIAWFANACYLPFEFLFVNKCKTDMSGCFRFAAYIYALSLISSIPLYLASSIKASKPSETIPVRHRLMFLGGILFTLISYLYLTYVQLSPPHLVFAICTIPGVLFTIYSLFKVGLTITEVLKRQRDDRTVTVLAFTFYGYGFLQLLYPFKLFFVTAEQPWIETLFLCFFIIAALLKISNGYCLIRALLAVNYPEFVRTRSALATTRERLRQQSRLAALGAIAASIEHDMKTPLAGISTKLELMRHLFQEPKIQEFLDKLEVDKSRLASIAKVVPFMRGAEEYYDRDRFMGKISVVELVNIAIRAVKVELELDTQKYFFRNRNADQFVRAYPPMLEQVIVNVIKNGIEAIRDAGKDGGAIKVVIRSIREIPEEILLERQVKPYAKWVRVDIEDNGCGIADENIPKVTTLYTTKLDRKANSGIGLFIANRIVGIHDGMIHISSKLNKGTTVSLFLPEWEAYQQLAKENDSTRQENKQETEAGKEIEVDAAEL